MKAGGPYRIYPAILSQIRNPQVRYGSAQPFHVSEFISVIWRAWAEFSRRNIRTRKFLNFVRGKFRIFYFYSLNNEGRRTLSYLSRNNFPCTKFRNFLVRKSRQKFRSRSSDDADKSWWNLRGMAGRFRIGTEDFVPRRVLRDRYDKVLRPSFFNE